ATHAGLPPRPSNWTPPSPDPAWPAWRRCRAAPDRNGPRFPRVGRPGGSDRRSVPSAHLQGRKTDEHEHHGDDPEAHDHARLRPTLELEMVMDRRHPEDALAGELEARDLRHQIGRAHV